MIKFITRERDRKAQSVIFEQCDNLAQSDNLAQVTIAQIKNLAWCNT